MVESTERSRIDNIDDRQLIALSLPERADLAPWLSRASAMYPLAICLGFLPAFLLVPVAQLDDDGARFGLRCLYETRNVEQLTSPSAIVAGEPFDGANRSLSVWLTSRLMAWTGLGGYRVLLIIPVLSVAIAAFLVWKFIAMVFDSRRALVTCFLFVSTPFFMMQSVLPQSACLGLACMIAGIWGCLEHFKRNSGYCSWSLLLGGGAWGLSFLSGGAAAWMVLVISVLLTDERVDAWLSGTPCNSSESSRRRHIGSLLIWCGTGLTTCIIGLLWLSDFQSAVATTISEETGVVSTIALNAATSTGDFAEQPAPVQTPSSFGTALLIRVWQELGWISGFAVCGLIRLLRRRDSGESTTRRRQGRTVFLLWMGWGLLTYLVFYAATSADFHHSVLKCWLMAGLVFLAAGELDALLKRQQGWWSIAGIWLIAMTLMSLSFEPVEKPSMVLFQGVPVVVLWWLSLLIVFAVAGLLLLNPRQMRRERWMTGAMILWPLVAQYAHMVPFSDLRDPELRHLETFCRELRRVPENTGCVFISQVTPPIHMQYTIASFEPTVQWEILRDNETLNTYMSSRFPSLGSSLVIHWGETENMLRLLRSEGLDFEPVSSPQFFKRRELHALHIQMKSLEQAGVSAMGNYWMSPHLPHGK
ncbi:MAG: glycosyltransferase family 39 protein [Planctomycetota bacterium]|nr:glycosyltransferase family 39 protein [Planctomycetota bacterium]MDA1214461.1 glycosyltransferase family 39 protein [Planctomycetota bacterium]